MINTVIVTTTNLGKHCRLQSVVCSVECSVLSRLLIHWMRLSDWMSQSHSSQSVSDWLSSERPNSLGNTVAWVRDSFRSDSYSYKWVTLSDRESVTRSHCQWLRVSVTLTVTELHLLYWLSSECDSDCDCECEPTGVKTKRTTKPSCIGWYLKLVRCPILTCCCVSGIYTFVLTYNCVSSWVYSRKPTLRGTTAFENRLQKQNRLQNNWANEIDSEAM